jgi:hypothetical protein
MNKLPWFLRLLPPQLWLYLAAILVASIVILVSIQRCTHSTSLHLEENTRIDITPLQIRQIKSIGQWQFLAIDDEELVDTTRYGFFGDDQLVRIYYGTLRLGIDLRQAQPHWLEMHGDTLLARLPGIALLDNDFIDEARTRSFLEQGSWSDADRERLYHRAYLQMKARALTKENLAAAQENARTQFSHLFRSMGFKHVRIQMGH